VIEAVEIFLSCRAIWRNGRYTIVDMARTKRATRTTLVQTAFRLPTDIIDAMALVRDRDGTLQSEQARRALRDWLTKRGALKAASGSRANRSSR
jgi:hypothetical protein